MMIDIGSRIKLKSPNLSVIGNAALKAGRKLVRDFSEVEHLQISRKGPGDFVSAADRKAENLIRVELLKARPDASFLMEESGRIDTDSDYKFIIDPLDGTNNFIHGLPHFCVSIALEHKDEVIAGVIYDPLRDEMFYAEKGMGSYMNDRRIRTSGRDRLADSLLAMTLAFGALDKKHVDSLRTRKYIMICEQAAGCRRSGSAALDLAYLSCGRLDGYYGVDLAPWDSAAGALILREAGGYMRYFNNGNHNSPKQTILASNGHVQVTIESYLQ